MSSTPEEPKFPPEERPEDPEERNLLGIYDQRQEGLHMQRIKVHRGQLSPAQFKALAELAREHTPDYPLHVTTRQDIQLHGVKPGAVPSVQAAIKDAGLTTVGACGDSLRNVTTCPENGLQGGLPDVSQMADAMRQAGESLPFIRNMPRKFKMSVSCCTDFCAKPWINDLGLVARNDGTFRAIGAGSLGRRPATGIELYESIEPSEVVPLTVAALKFFNAEGNREKRYSARWRHVRERMGNHSFRERLDEEFKRELREGDWPAPDVPAVSNGLPLQAHLRLPLGDLEADTALELARSAQEAGGTIRLGFEHDVFVFAEEELHLGSNLRSLEGGPRIVACPGTTWCSRGLADSRRVERELREDWPEGLDLSLGFSGCPNNCAHAGVADIGVTGRIKELDGARTRCFRLWAGGGKGKTAELGRQLHAVVPQDEIVGAIVRVAQKYAPAGDGRFPRFVRQNEDGLIVAVEDEVSIPANGPAG